MNSKKNQEQAANRKPVRARSEAKTVLDVIRFGLERRLIETLYARFGIGRVLRRTAKDAQQKRRDAYSRAQSMRVSKALSPRLVALVDLARNRTQFGQPVDLFVDSQTDINACAVLDAIPGAGCRIMLTAGAVQRLTDEEMLFVLGHEIGHHYWGHVQEGRIAQAYDNSPPPLLAKRLGDWSRYAEFSADRAGMAACGYDLDAAVSVMFKIQCGLGPEHLNYKLSELLAHAAALEKAALSDFMEGETHPLVPLRAAALHRFAKLAREGMDPGRIAAADDAVEPLARLMDYEDRTPSGAHFREALLCCGLLASHMGGKETIRAEDWNRLVEGLLPYTSDPERMLSSVKSLSNASKRSGKALEWIRKHTGPERFEFLAEIVDVVVSDAVVTKAEEGFVLDVADALDIPATVARRCLRERHLGVFRNATIKDPPKHGLR